MFRKTRIGTMFLSWFLIIALIPLVFFGYTSSRKTMNILKNEAENRLISIADNKARQIMTYLSEREKDVTSLARSPAIINAIMEYKAAFKEAEVDQQNNELSSMNYERVEREYRQYFAHYKETAGYHDLILISPEGDVIQTVAKEDDFEVNLMTAPYRDSELAKVFERAKTLLETSMSDYKYYMPSNGPAAFIAAPVLNKGKLVGVIALQVDNDEVRSIVNDFTGLGETGETVVASIEGDQVVFVMPTRHNPHAAFSKKLLIESEEVLSIHKAVKGEKGYGVSLDYRSKEVLAVWRYLPHLRWGMVVKIDTEEAFQSIVHLRQWSFFIGVITVIGVILSAFLVSGSISNPIINLTKTTRRIAGGDITSKVDIKGSVEIGELGTSFNKMMDQLEASRIEMIGHRDHLKEMVDERTKELKETQEQLISEERFAVLGKLSGSIAHEIRNPLATIDSTAYYLKRKLKDADEKTRSRLDRIINEVKESTDIIQSLQDLTKLKEPQKTRIDLHGIIEDGIEMSNIPRAVELVNNATRDKLLVDVDGKQIAIVLRNILANAIQAMEGKGTIRITAGKAEDGFVDVSLMNSGPGIEPENLGKVFQPFYGTKTGGFGYGLTICKMIMKKNGGSIKAQSGKEKGVTFILRIPFAV
ncbi:MAG: HAMP domain-containing protein [Candidatus Scalindua sp.]|nr:HAMP domain-containing protein [Candidatus Scalindua sp.]